MEYLKLAIIFATFLIFGCINSAHCNPSFVDEKKNYDYAEDDDYNYDEDDENKSEGLPIESNAINGDPPYFEISELNVKANFGDNIVLNCDVRNFQLKNAVMWYKQQNLIVNGQTSLDKHVEVLKNNSIRILNVQDSDADDYYCTVLPEQVKLHINLAVGGKLAIYSDGRDVTEKTVTVHQGESHTLECKAFVNENATIKWALNGERAENLDIKLENGKLIIDYFDADLAGIYQCLGDDGSKDPLHGSVTIDVHYAPKVTTHRHHVNTERGGRAELYCDYKAVPIAVAEWKRNGQYLEYFSDKYSVKSGIHKGKNRTILMVKDVGQTDLGEYECEVKNAIGANENKIHLIYEPENPQFEDMKIDGRKVTLYWLVKSVQPLSEAVMDYKIDGTYTWSSESIISTSKHPENTGIWKLKHEIELVPGFWHARVKTKNTVGWSKFSNEHNFKIDESSEEDNVESIVPQDIILAAGIGSGIVTKPTEESSAAQLTLVRALIIGFSLISLIKEFVPYFTNF
ncbi:protein amalgam [Episyrphus balteatus]|uniref:protein amalgam n=1 Tax=Episyrphus balteatus TaxID=286459 RepID=UPI002486BC21|nr:protein amalgam [Episyrphus balteatus]